MNTRFKDFSFGSIRIDGITYEHDVVIDRGKIRKRKKNVSKKFRDEFGHTPLCAEEKIPWKCRRLVVGTGAYGRLPVMKQVKLEAERRKIELLVLPTAKAIEALEKDARQTNAILHVTCRNARPSTASPSPGGRRPLTPHDKWHSSRVSRNPQELLIAFHFKEAHTRSE